MQSYDPMRQPKAARRALFLRHPVASVLLGCPAAGAVLGFTGALLTSIGYYGSSGELLFSLPGVIFSGALIIGCFILFPLVISIIDFCGIFKRQTPENRRTYRIFAVLTIVFGFLLSTMFLMVWNIMPGAEWHEQLYNLTRHQPVFTGSLAPVLCLAVLGLAGYILLSAVRIDRLPPLLTALAIAAMYLGAVPAVFWCLQIGLPVLGIGQDQYANAGDLFLCLLPADYILLSIGLVRDKIHEWNEHPRDCGSRFPDPHAANGRPAAGFARRSRLLARFDDWLADSANWPLGGLLLAVPLLGVLLGMLVLFGQSPDQFVRAWTETADWGLSQRIAPQNAFYDEHYLCTVAAGGHGKIVRPMRYGERHGHRIVVNRQLLIANAFEQLLEERLPGAHRKLRRFYDTYGFPLSRLIRTKEAADLTWLLMKPPEWLFLLILYLCDARPENRIAVQYMPRR